MAVDSVSDFQSVESGPSHATGKRGEARYIVPTKGGRGGMLVKEVRVRQLFGQVLLLRSPDAYY